MKRIAGGHSSVGAVATLLSSHAGDPRAATGDKTALKSAHNRQAVSESARRQPEDLPKRAGHHHPATERISLRSGLLRVGPAAARALPTSLLPFVTHFAADTREREPSSPMAGVGVPAAPRARPA
jgi:hypothetical protein